MAISEGFFELLELRSRISSFHYDRLNLKYLDLLRSEVDEEVERRCAAAKQEREWKERARE